MMKLIAVRHGKAAPGDDDLTRVLSPQGIEQAKDRAESFNHHSIGLLLVSPATRAIETAKYVFPDIAQVIVPELYLPESAQDKLDCDAAFTKLGYATTRAYVEADTGWLHRWSWNALRGIYREVHNRQLIPSEVAVVGHAVFSNLIGAVMFSEHAEQLLDLPLGEAQGYVAYQNGLALELAVD